MLEFLSSLFDDNVEKVTAKEVAEGNFTVLDVRKPGDYRAGYIPGALNLPYSQVEEKMEQVLGDVDRRERIAVVCVRGISSQAVVKKLIEAGYKNAKSLKGGMRSWEGKLATK